jgi:hypothetical protein
MRLEHRIERVLRGPHEVAEFLAEFALARWVPHKVAVFDEDLGVLKCRWSVLGELGRGRGDAYVEVPICDGVVGCALDGLERGFGDEADEAFYYAVDLGGVFYVVAFSRYLRRVIVRILP